MPWTKCICPTREEKTFEECLACTHPCFDLEIREAMFEKNEDQAEEHTGKNITVSALTNCLRNVYLERITDYAATPKSQWWSLRGTLIHKIVERPNVYTEEYRRECEKRLYVDVDIGDGIRVPISGQMDVYTLRFLKQGILKDWKSIGDNGLRYIIQDGAKKEHIEQTNDYAYICRKNGLPAHKIVIVYMTLMDVVQTGKITTFSEYLKNPPEKKGARSNMVGTPRQVKVFPSGKIKWETDYMVNPVPVWTDEKTLSVMTPKIRILYEAFENRIMPPKCDTDMQEWKCESYCNIKKECDAYESDQAFKED